jgi:hypothetical protein
MKRIFIVLVCLALTAVLLAEPKILNIEQIETIDGLETYLREPIFPGNLQLQNGVVIENSTNNVFELTENSESLLLTFASDSIVISSDTSAVLSFGTLIPNVDGLDVDGYVYLNPVSSVAATEGFLYYDSDTNSVQYRNNSGWVELTAGTGDNTLDAAYDQGSQGGGKKVDVDTGAIEFEVDDAADNPALHLDCDNVTNDPVALLIENAADAANAISIDIDAQSTGRDIEGSGATWHVTGLGVGTFSDVQTTTATVTGVLTASVGVTLDSAETITNATNTEIAFTQNGGEDVIIDLDAGSNAVGLKSSTGVDELAMGTVDDLTGVGTIVMDAIAASITLTADAGAEDFTISQAGGVDASLILSSAGTGADALQVSSSAGGIDITVAGAAAGEDLDLTSDAAINLTSSEAADLAINIATSNAAGQIQITSTDTTADGLEIDSAGGIDIDAADDVAIDLSGAGKNFDVDSAAGSVYLDGGEAASNAVVIDASDAAGGIDIDAGTGGITVDITGAADFRLDSSAGSVVLVGAEAAADAVTIDAEDAAGGIDIDAGTGGITVDITGAADFRLDSSAGSIYIEGAEAAVDGIALQASGGGIDVDAVDDISIVLTAGSAGEDLILQCTGAADTSVQITSSGTAANAIDIDTSAGGIDIDMAGGAAGEDFQITTATSIDLVSTEANAGQFKMDAQGTIAGFAIILETTDGGIQLNADNSANGDITIDAADVIALTTADSIVIDGGPIVPDIEYITADGENLLTYGTTDLDSSGAELTYVLGSPTLGTAAVGTIKTITMSTAGNNGDITITNHETSDPEVARFDAADEYIVLVWTGTEWATVSNSCTFP